MNNKYQKKRIANLVAATLPRGENTLTAHGDKLKPQRLLQWGAMITALSFGMTAFAAEAEVAAEPKVVAAKGDTTQALPVVNVKTSKTKAQDGYQATKTRVGKVLQDPHDIPQAITTVTRKLMTDQQVGSLKEALRNVSGLTFNAAEGGRSGDNFMLRGFYTFGDIYLDGIRDTAQYNRETFNLEQVDVLRGSAAMLFGRGQAGGVINQVSKTAKLTDANYISASLGNYGYNQETADFNKKLGDTTAIRINLMERSDETYRRNPVTGARPELNRQGIALSFGTGIGTNNEFFLNHVTTETRDIPDYGISFSNRRPLNTATHNDKTFYGNSNNFDDSKTNITTGIFTHKFSNDTEWRTQVRSADYERAYWAKTPSATDAPSSNNSIGGNQTRNSDYETLTLQTDFSTKIDFAGMQHSVLAGAEYLKENASRNSLQQYNATTGQLFTQTTNAALTAARIRDGVVYFPDRLSTAVPNVFKADNYAVYAQDTIKFAQKWDLLVGMRRDELRADYANSTTSPSLSYGENSYRTGLSYHQNVDRHYYINYTDSFSPTADLYQLTTIPLPPERSDTKEIGSKWLFLDGDLSFRAALYRTEKEWERNTDLESTAALASKKRHTSGLEFEVAGKITDDWDVFGGIAFMNAKIDEQYDGVAQGSFASVTNNGTARGPTGIAGTGYANGEALDANQTVYTQRSQQVSEGQRARNTPAMTFNLWSTYRISGNWRFGAGVEAKGERSGYGVGTCGTTSQDATTGRWSYNNCATTFAPNLLPGYARIDAMLAYEEKKWAVRLNVKNLMDKTYYDALYDNGAFSVPGNRRQAIVTTEFKF